MDEPKNAGSAAAAYAAGLRAAVHGFTARGGTQKEIAVGAHIAPATLSRYLSSERVAPHHFIAALDTFLAERGLPLAAGVREELTRLCGRAHEASRSPAVQLAHLKEELLRIREEKQAGEAELTVLKQRAEQLAVELEQALEQARHAEAGWAVLEGRVERQDKQLRDAQSYTRGLEAELTAQHDQVLLVQREVEVLRRQNKTLLEETPRRIRQPARRRRFRRVNAGHERGSGKGVLRVLDAGSLGQHLQAPDARASGNENRARLRRHPGGVHRREYGRCG
ncbi:hypothetical protein [Streptomyces sp. NRRL F-2580]|uniref:hypothetical protein n=1 Tax=Streptomyces sp. NRRL F-2580 TaxID=1463841 RepID=UPI000B33C403|nr:hypothetical protein [Streptomyces sp. NRRL F-2580]